MGYGWFCFSPFYLVISPSDPGFRHLGALVLSYVRLLYFFDFEGSTFTVLPVSMPLSSLILVGRFAL